MADQDLRIGTLNEDGTVKEWPRYNIMGGQYHQPAIQQPIGGGRFVVLTAGFTRWELVDVLKGLPPTHTAEQMAKSQLPETYVFDDPGTVVQVTPTDGVTPQFEVIPPAPTESSEDTTTTGKRRRGGE